MKRLLCVLLLTVAPVGLAAPPSGNQAGATPGGGDAAARAVDNVGPLTDMQALRAAAKNDKRALVSRALDLSPAEAKRFWPIYDDYQRDLEGWSRRRVVALEGVLFRDADITNPAAKNLVKELMLADEAEIKARRTLRKQVMRVLPAVKAARYLQLEDKLQSIRDYDIASTVPLVH
jgi:hypothetical protein